MNPEQEGAQPRPESTDQPTNGTKTLSDELASLTRELASVREESEHRREQWMLAAANLENYKKRVQRERQDLQELCLAATIGRLLPILDDLERAFATLPDDLHSLTWTDGLALVHRKMYAILEELGLREIEALGKPFDPAVHQAIVHKETDTAQDGYVLEVLQKGYRIGGRILRPALTSVARAPSGSGPTYHADISGTSANPATSANDNAGDPPA